MPENPVIHDIQQTITQLRIIYICIIYIKTLIFWTTAKYIVKEKNLSV